MRAPARDPPTPPPQGHRRDAGDARLAAGLWRGRRRADGRGGACGNSAPDVPAFGVIPQHLVRREVGKRDLTTFVVTEDMHERKKVMYMNSNAIVVLPGGAGSLDELFEVLTWRQLGLHAKPILLLDTEGYWQPLVALLRHLVNEGFAEASLLDYAEPLPDVAALEVRLATAFA